MINRTRFVVQYHLYEFITQKNILSILQGYFHILKAFTLLISVSQEPGLSRLMSSGLLASGFSLVKSMRHQQETGELGVFVPKPLTVKSLSWESPSSGKHRSWQAALSTHSPSLRPDECSHSLPLVPSHNTRGDTACSYYFPSSHPCYRSYPFIKFPSDYLHSVVYVSS